MLPIGGETIWGNTTFAPDDIVSIPSINNPQQPIEEKNVGHTNGILVALQTELFATKTSTDSGSSSSSSSSSSSNVTRQNVTAGQIRDFLSKIDGNLKKFNEWFSSGIATDDLSLPKYDQFKYWTNPLESALPKAPNMKFFCLYGIGKPVERAYAYHPNSMEKEEQVYNKNGDSIVPYMLDTTQNDPPWISLGIRYVDGDGTVPLISLGFMCAKGWRKKKYNPSQMEIRIREYRHNPLPLIYDPRGGPSTSDHVDIMGNHEMITDILNIVAKKYDQVPEQIHSEILKIAQRVELPE
jgi:phospholipid:diacylglycerol acyltransferase